ncbi:ABC transporter substrate-binding protein [Rhodopila sp.]|uniref:ABC transporter substrate-binding protein n=1 Tax=Rhodopila sp. TaxID=2480087 RepID=UPI003D115B46
MLRRRGFIGQSGVAMLASAARADQPPRTLKPGVLRIGTYFVNPPFEFVSNHKRVGFEVDLMREISLRLDLRANFIDTRWQLLLNEMQQSRYDCAIGGITITPRRQQILGWSVPYMTTTLSLVVDGRRTPATATLADLKMATVGVQAATTDYDAAVAMKRSGRIGKVAVYPFARIADAISDLVAGRIGAVMKVYPVASWLARTTPGLRILGQVPDDPQPLGIGFNLKNAQLLAAVNHVLGDMRADGSYDGLVRRWHLA